MNVRCTIWDRELGISKAVTPSLLLLLVLLEGGKTGVTRTRVVSFSHRQM